MWGRDVDLDEWYNAELTCEQCGVHYASYQGLSFSAGGSTVRIDSDESKCYPCLNVLADIGK